MNHLLTQKTILGSVPGGGYGLVLHILRGSWRNLQRFICLTWVRYDIQCTWEPGEATTPVCYVLERDQLLDKLVLDDVCVNRSWQRPFMPIPGIRAPGGDAYLSLRGFKGLIFRRAVPKDSRELNALVEWTEKNPHGDLKLVPVAVFWGRSPQRTRSWLKLLVAESWTIAGRTRRFFAFLVHGRDVLDVQEHRRASPDGRNGPPPHLRP